MVSQGTDKSRRKALKTMAAGAASWPTLVVLKGFGQGHAGHYGAKNAPAAKAGAKKARPFQPAFFTAAEFAAVSERIIPTDGTPGAREAKVSEFIDQMVKETPELHPLYRQGLAWLDAEARKKHQRPFVKLSAAEQDELLRVLAETKEPSPENQAGVKFFRSVRGLTIDGFYTSKVGLKELGYTGNTYLLEFKGCTHPEHGS